MKNRFAFEMAVGLVGLVAVLFLGSKGMVALVLFAFFPLVVRKSGGHRPDERELQLFYRAGNWTVVLIILSVLVIYLASPLIINGNRVGDNWYLLTVSSILIVHGLAGLAAFRDQQGT